MAVSRIALLAIGAAMACTSTDAWAKDSFSGPYVGAAVGAVDHHFVAEEQNGAGKTRRFNVTRWGLGGELFGGFDLAVAPRLRLGAEGQIEGGGRTAVEQNSSYTLGIRPRYGFSISAHAGYVASPRLLVYAGAGYGQHYYRAFAAGNAAPSALAGLDLTRSFILRGGAEMRMTRATGIRLEFEHLDGTRNQFMIGVPIRF